MGEAPEAPPSPEKPKTRPAKPKEQCRKCLGRYAPSVLEYKTHKCIPPTLDGENLAAKKAQGAPGGKEEEVPVPMSSKEAVLDEEAPGQEAPVGEIPARNLAAVSPPPAPEPLARQTTLVIPEELPSHEQVAKWVSFERQSQRERKRERWQQQMFGP